MAALLVGSIPSMNRLVLRQSIKMLLYGELGVCHIHRHLQRTCYMPGPGNSTVKATGAPRNEGRMPWGRDRGPPSARLPRRLSPEGDALLPGPSLAAGAQGAWAQPQSLEGTAVAVPGEAPSDTEGFPIPHTQIKQKKENGDALPAGRVSLDAELRFRESEVQPVPQEPREPPPTATPG